MPTDYMPAIISSISALSGVLITQVFNSINKRIDKKDQFLIANYRLRQEAYANIYLGLVEYEVYFKKFTNPGNEFYESEEWNLFAPLVENTEFHNLFIANEIWLDENTVKQIKDLMIHCGALNNLAIYICGQSDEADDNFITEEKVRMNCETVINEMHELKNRIKKRCTMNELDKHYNKLIGRGKKNKHI